MSLTMYSLSREAQIPIVRRDEWCHEGVLSEKTGLQKKVMSLRLNTGQVKE